MKIMTVRAPDEVQRALQTKAQKMGLARNALILVILNEWIQRNAGKKDGKPGD